MPRAIGLLIFEDFQLLDAAGPISAFEVGGRTAGDPYELRVLATEAGEVVVLTVAPGKSWTNGVRDRRTQF